jgi:hypothetical protein
VWTEPSGAPDDPDLGTRGVTEVLVCVLWVVLPSTVLEPEVVIRVVVVPSVDVTLCTVTRPCDDEEWEGCDVPELVWLGGVSELRGARPA